MAEPKKQAPKAKEAYKNGTITTYNWDDTPRIIYQRHLAYPHGIPKEISIVDANDNDFIHPISRKIRREIRMGMYPEGLMTNDTVYVEAPRHNGIVTRKYRVASKYEPNGDEYKILKKRFDEAKSVSSPSKKQQGGQLNMNEQELQQAFIQYLAQKTGAKTQQELEAVIQQMGQEGLQREYQEFIQLIQQQQIQRAEKGAKLNYIKQLRGECPEGYEMQYYRVGGKVCKKCMKKKCEEGGNVPTDPIDSFKCGRKTKKCEQGGTIDFAKCGKKMKKKEEGGSFVPFDKCGKKMKKCEDGKKFPLIEKGKDGKNKTVYYKDEATRDSIAANKYNDQEVQTMKPGSYKKGKWTPDRSKYPYKKK